MSTTTTEPTRKNAPRPTPDTPLYPYGDYLADADGYLYKPTGEPDGQVPRSGVGDPREGWSSLQPQADSCCSAQALFVVGRMDRVKHLSKLFV